MTASTCRAVEVAAHAQMIRVEGRERRKEEYKHPQAPHYAMNSVVCVRVAEITNKEKQRIVVPCKCWCDPSGLPKKNDKEVRKVLGQGGIRVCKRRRTHQPGGEGGRRSGGSLHVARGALARLPRALPASAGACVSCSTHLRHDTVVSTARSA